MENDFDYEKIRERVKKNDIKVIEIQRSRGYSLRKSITLDKIEKVIKEIRKVNDTAIIMVDNCYGEFTNEGKDVGPTLGMNKKILQGLFFAPSVVASSLKTAILTAKVLEKLGYKVDPKWDEKRTDIVQTISFGDREKLIKYVQGIQMGSPVDSSSLPIPGDMPGYTDQVIMAAGAFTQGSSIELSCDAPLRPPFIAFQQGGLTYEYGKLGLIKAVNNILK